MNGVKPRSSKHTVFFFNDTATTEIYTLSLHDALPIFRSSRSQPSSSRSRAVSCGTGDATNSACAPSGSSGSGPYSARSLDRKSHTSELQSRQYLVCRLLLEKKNQTPTHISPPTSASAF